MQTLFEAASHIAQEIERTRQHLVNLEQALDGLKPLITVDAATATMTYSMSDQAQPVEDLSVVDADVSAAKKTKSKVAVKIETGKSKAAKAKASKVQAVEAEVVVPEPVVVAVKLPSTGAELWLKCLGRKKSSVNQIVDAALKKLKLDDSARSKITNRVTAWANAAEKKGVLVAAGVRDGFKLYQLAPAKEGVADQSVDATEPVVAAETAPVIEVSEVA